MSDRKRKGLCAVQKAEASALGVDFKPYIPIQLDLTYALLSDYLAHALKKKKKKKKKQDQAFKFKYRYLFGLY